MKKTKKFLSILLSMLMIISALPMTVLAEEVENIEQTEKQTEAQVEEKTEIEAKSAETSSNNVDLQEPDVVGDYEYAVLDEAQKTAEITNYNGTDKDVTIPSTIDGYTITGIGNSAFAGNENLESVKFGDNITAIHESAFSNCKKIADVFIPSDVTIVENFAFNNCSDNLVICAKGSYKTGTPTALEQYATDNNIDFVDITRFRYTVLDEDKKTAKIIGFWTTINIINNFLIPEKIDGYTIVAIDENALNNKKFTRLVIPNTITEIGDEAFNSCTELRHLEIPQSVTSIGDGAFYNCKQIYGSAQIREINISGRIKHIGAKAFGYYIENGVERKFTTDEFVVRGYKNSTAEEYATEHGFTFVPYDLGYQLNDDGTATLNGYYGNDADVVFPSTIDGYKVSHLGERAFQKCNFVNIIISEGITDIDTSSFGGCKSLKTISFPSTLKHIAYGAFTVCNALENFNIPEGIETIGPSAFRNSAIKTVTIPSSLKVIEKSVFDSCESLESIVIPSTVEEIGESAFARCSSLKNITFGTGVKNIGTNAFESCTSLESVTIPSNITTVNNYTFRYCSNLKEVVIEEGVKKLGYYSFGDNEKLESVKLPSTLEYMDRAFANCPSLETIALPDNLKTLTAYSFIHCTGLKSITIPKNIEKIEVGTFTDCTALTDINFSDNLTTIDDSAFKNCTSLVNITFPNSLETIGADAFLGCTGLKNVVIPDSVKTIRDTAFRYCSGLESAVLSKNMNTISAGLFDSCPSLKDVVIPDGISSIEFYAFYNCFQLKSVTIPESVTNIDFQALGYGDNTEELIKTEDLVIYGKKGSAAEKYANDNGFEFVWHTHDWQDATCTEPKTCKTCSETEGEPLGHDWQEATCFAPKTCARCGLTQGDKKEHNYKVVEKISGNIYKAKCTYCGDIINNYKAQENNYINANSLVKGQIIAAGTTVYVDGYFTDFDVRIDGVVQKISNNSFVAPACLKCTDVYVSERYANVNATFTPCCVYAYANCTSPEKCIYCGSTRGDIDPDAHSIKVTVRNNVYTYTCSFGCGLKYTVDKNALVSAIAVANNEYINTGVADKKYVSIEALKDAVNNAQAVLDSESAKQDDVNNAVSSIQTAISELELKQYTVTVYKDVYGNSYANEIAVAYGEVFNYTMELGENESVYKWIMSVNDKDIRLNTIEQSISQVITGDTTFICYADNNKTKPQDTARVVFYDKGNRVIKLDYVPVGSSIDMNVPAPKIAFYDFAGWETVSGDPTNVDKSGVAFRAMYTPSNVAANKSTIVGLNGVKVNGKQTTTEFYDARIELTGASSYAYCDKDGNILQGINGNIIYAPNNSETIYVCAGVSDKASTSITGVIDETNKLTINAQYYLPSDCTAVEAGVVISKTNESPTINGVECVALKSSQQGTSGEYSISLTHSKAGTINAVSYLTYKDNQGTMHTVYSDAQAITYRA